MWMVFLPWTQNQGNSHFAKFLINFFPTASENESLNLYADLQLNYPTHESITAGIFFLKEISPTFSISDI